MRAAMFGAMALLGGASIGAALGHLRDHDAETPKIVRSYSPYYGPVASVAIPLAATPVAKAAPPVSKPHALEKPVTQAAAPVVSPAKLPQPNLVVPAAVLTPAPSFEKFEKSPGGDALAAWRRHAVTVDVAPGVPVIAIVIDDMGLDQRRSMRAVALKRPLTLAYLPYARDLAAQTWAAHIAGHELLVHMPMEPQGGENPGPGALTVGMGSDEIAQRVAESFERVPFAVGLNNHMGSRFTRDAGALRPVMAELKRRGVLFLDSRTAPDSVGTVVARVNKVPYAERDVFLDNEATTTAVRARLAETEQVARKTGAAVAIGHPHDGTLEALEEWLVSVEQRGFALVPITNIVARREARQALQARVETQARRP